MKRKQVSLSEAQNSYQFPYIAAMTILCIFFLMMYAYYAKIFEDSQSVQNEKLVQRVEDDLSADKSLSEAAKVEKLDDGVRITLPTSLLFDLGSAGIKDGVRPSLEKLSQSIKTLPEDFKVSVEGHTDNVPVYYGGDFSSNWELSLYRSLSIIDLFIAQGNPAERFVATGYSEYRPLYPNDSTEHKAANRRVEIVIRHRETESRQLEDVSGTKAEGPEGES